MRLTDKQVKECLDKFRFELSEEELRQEWEFDRARGFQTVNKPLTGEMRCINLIAPNGAWLRLDMKDLSQEQVEALLMADIESPEAKEQRIIDHFTEKYGERCIFENEYGTRYIIKSVKHYNRYANEVEVEADVIWNAKKGVKGQLTEWFAEPKGYGCFEVDNNGDLTGLCHVDEEFEALREEVYDYLGRVCDQNGVCPRAKDKVAIYQDGLFRCEVMSYDPVTEEYELRDTLSDRVFHVIGCKLLVVERYNGGRL